MKIYYYFLIFIFCHVINNPVNSMPPTGAVQILGGNGEECLPTLTVIVEYDFNPNHSCDLYIVIHEIGELNNIYTFLPLDINETGVTIEPFSPIAFLPECEGEGSLNYEYEISIAILNESNEFEYFEIGEINRLCDIFNNSIPGSGTKSFNSTICCSGDDMIATNRNESKELIEMNYYPNPIGETKLILSNLVQPITEIRINGKKVKFEKIDNRILLNNNLFQHRLNFVMVRFKDLTIKSFKIIKK